MLQRLALLTADRCLHAPFLSQAALALQTTASQCWTRSFARAADSKKDAEEDVDRPRVALVGRPNVGKSALFNRLVGNRAALVHNTPQSHVTRDWKEGDGKLSDLRFTVIDTCGIEPHAHADTIQGRGTKLTARMLQNVHLALLVIDGREGLVGPDEDLAGWLGRHMPRDRVVLVINKAENNKAQKRMSDTVSDSYRLGYGDPVAVSASTGEGMSDLYTAIQSHIDSITAALNPHLPTSTHHTTNTHTTHSQTSPTPTTDTAQPLTALNSDSSSESDSDLSSESESDSDMVESVSDTAEDGNEEGMSKASNVRLAIVGLPNVGKSTLLNQLLGEERCVTGPEPGLTRDPIRARLQYNDRTVELVDTAGYMPVGRVDRYDDIGGDVAEKARAASLGALRRAHVVVLVVDVYSAVKTERVLQEQELALVSRVCKAGKSLVLAVNKMDALESREERRIYMDTLHEALSERLTMAGQIQVVPMSAKEGRNVDKLLPAVLRAHKNWSNRVGAAALNTWLHKDILANAQPGGITRHLRRIKYVTQVQTCPPTVLCFVTGEEPIPRNVEAYLASQIRQKFDMRSTPIRFWFRHRLRKQRNPLRLRAPALPPRSAAAAAGGGGDGGSPSARSYLLSRAKETHKEGKTLRYKRSGLASSASTLGGPATKPAQPARDGGRDQASTPPSKAKGKRTREDVSGGAGAERVSAELRIRRKARAGSRLFEE